MYLLKKRNQCFQWQCVSEGNLYFINTVETAKLKEYLRQTKYMKKLGAQYYLTTRVLTL